MQDQIKDVVLRGIKAKGKTELLKHLSGKCLSRKEAILAHCYSCRGFYVESKSDCQSPHCSLYSFMPYRETAKKGNA